MGTQGTGKIGVSTFLPFLSPIILDYAASKFTENARRKGAKTYLVLQVPDNAADSVNLRAPCGFKYLRYKAG